MGSSQLPPRGSLCPQGTLAVSGRLLVVSVITRPLSPVQAQHFLRKENVAGGFRTGRMFLSLLAPGRFFFFASESKKAAVRVEVEVGCPPSFFLGGAGRLRL